MSAVPNLDLSPTIYCGDDDCTGYAACDGDHWWCEKCGATWDMDGENGERR